eukprot:6885620-Lingulodinium_polyedra.AAC.1
MFAGEAHTICAPVCPDEQVVVCLLGPAVPLQLQKAVAQCRHTRISARCVSENADQEQFGRCQPISIR